MRVSVLPLLLVVALSVSSAVFARDTLYIDPDDMTQLRPDEVLPADVRFEHHTSVSAERATTCPPPEALYKDDLIWRGNRGWRSYQTSFIDNIAQFVGAYWIGVGVGKMHCIYDGQEELTFRLRLENDNMFVKVPESSDGAWVEHGEGNRKCISNNVNDCSFVFLLPGDQGMEMEELIGLKRAPVFDGVDGDRPTELGN